LTVSGQQEWYALKRQTVLKHILLFFRIRSGLQRARLTGGVVLQMPMVHFDSADRSNLMEARRLAEQG